MGRCRPAGLRPALRWARRHPPGCGFTGGEKASDGPDLPNPACGWKQCVYRFADTGGEKGRASDFIPHTRPKAVCAKRTQFGRSGHEAGGVREQTKPTRRRGGGRVSGLERRSYGKWDRHRAAERQSQFARRAGRGCSPAAVWDYRSRDAGPCASTGGIGRILRAESIFPSTSGGREVPLFRAPLMRPCH